MIDLATIKTKTLEIVTKLVSKLSEQSSLAGIVSIGLMIGITAPQASIWAGGIVAVAGLLRIFLPDSPK